MSKNTQLASLINYISVDGSGNVILSSGQIIATQNYVATAVSNLVASAPSTLDTLNELATALGNDANFATTVTNSIATKLPLSGGTLTGNLNFNSIYGSTISSYSGTAWLGFSYKALSHLWEVNGSNAMVLGANGLGIGTVNPQYKLDVNGTGNFTGALSGTSATFSSSITANRFYGNYTTVLNTYTTVNPSTNVLLTSPPNDRDAWIYLDQADSASNWGIYHRQIDSAVSGLESNSIGFIGAGTLKAFIGLQTGNGYFSGVVNASRFISNVTNSYGLVLNRIAVNTYNGMSLQTAGSAQWFLGMRENLSSNNYIIYSEPIATDVLTLNSANGSATFSNTSSQSIRITSSFALSSGYADAFQMLYGNQTGGGVSLNIGKSESTRNLAKMVYTHVANGSTSNRLGFGFYDADGLLNILASGSIGIGTTTPGAYILALDYNATAAAVMSIKNSSVSGYSGVHILNNAGSVVGHWGYANGSTAAPLTDTVYFGSTAAKSVVFTTADTIRMSINTSGHVTRPFQPSFMAYSTNVSITGGTWQLISNSITTEAYDISSNYSGGRFTAPVAGRYYFFFGGWSNINSNGERYGISFVVNSGSTFYIAGGNYCIVDSPLAGASIVHNLNAGDYVELHCFSSVGGTWGGGHGVWWGGYLL